MKLDELLGRIKALRDERSRSYDADLQVLLSEVVTHLEMTRDIVDEHVKRGAVTTPEVVDRLDEYFSTGK